MTVEPVSQDAFESLFQCAQFSGRYPVISPNHFMLKASYMQVKLITDAMTYFFSIDADIIKNTYDKRKNGSIRSRHTYLEKLRFRLEADNPRIWNFYKENCAQTLYHNKSGFSESVIISGKTVCYGKTQRTY